MLEACQKVSTKGKLEKITDVMCIEKGRKTVQAEVIVTSFLHARRGRFCQSISPGSRLNPKHYTARVRTNINGTVSNETIKIGACMSTYSYCMLLFVNILLSP